MKRVIVLLVALTLFTGLLAGCAGKNTEKNTDSKEAATPTQAAESTPVAEAETTQSPEDTSGTPAEEASWPRTFTDAAGKEVTLAEEPQRIAILHSMYLEYFFALGTPPVASAGANVGTAMQALEEFATLKPYLGTAEIMDLGSARELNLEAILAAEPDVIVTFNGHGGVDELYDELTKIAPVVLLDYTASWQDSIRECARIVGKESIAEECIQETETIVDKAREDLSGYSDKTTVFVRSDGKGGVFALGYARYPYYYDTETGFGLSKPETYPEEWGVISLEALAEMNPDYILFQDYESDARKLVEDLSASTVWQNLKAVKADQVLYLDVSLNTTSPLSLQVAAKQLVEGLVK